MDDIGNLNDNFENINKNFENDLDMEKLRKELKKRLEEYGNIMKYMATDAPIGVLCLPPQIEKILLDHGILRIYDLFDLDLIKIKGLGKIRIKELTSRLDQFLSML